ncbi:MAG: hypothetical protein N3F05_02130 [Candidatus Diapherotrites archaeon]|nr:hypothetical protein [Candidatus Diapherotrites archaeon]
MSDMGYLYYTTVTPYREILVLLSKANAMNPHSIAKNIPRYLERISAEKVQKALFELEKAGLIVQVNGCYLICEDWLKQLVLFLNEFNQLESELDNCNAVFSSKAKKAQANKFLNET